MRKTLGSLFSKRAADTPEPPRQPAPAQINLDGLPTFQVAAHLNWQDGFPLMDWKAVRAWLKQSGSAELRAAAWAACEQAWLTHLRDTLGGNYRLIESERVAVLTAQAPKAAAATLAYMDRTLDRVTRLLQGIARVHPWGWQILIVFDDADSYYNYVSCYYPESGGEFAFSSGIHISRGCAHFATHHSDLRVMEPVIAHEMTHGCLSHLPLPLWVNEGIAVNTERQVARSSANTDDPRELRDKLQPFWNEAEIQEFWSGKSFDRADDGNKLSYDLATLFISLMSKDWDRFTSFVLDADWRDGGAAAAREHLGLDLGEAVCLILEKPDNGAWGPVYYTIRKAMPEDRAALEALIARSALQLGAKDYTRAQIEGALRGAFGVDTQLIEDGTYFAVEIAGHIVGCGGWSRRRTLFGGDSHAERNAAELDPAAEPARIRAFFVAPEHARKGIGSLILERCEDEARAFGFSRLELMATLPGVRLYARHGYVADTPIQHELAPGLTIEFVPMRKMLQGNSNGGT